MSLVELLEFTYREVWNSLDHEMRTKWDKDLGLTPEGPVIDLPVIDDKAAKKAAALEAARLVGE